MKNILKICLAISPLLLAGCSGTYETGDYYSSGDVKGIVVKSDADGKARLVLSFDEVANLNADSAARWVAEYDNGQWRLPTNEEMTFMKKHRSLINKTLERKGQPLMLAGFTYYWTSTACSESHTYAGGPEGVKCYFNSNASPNYKARAVRDIE